MWTWILIGVAGVCAGVAFALRRRVAPDPTAELDRFVADLSAEISVCGADYEVRGVVPGTFTMVITVKGQEVPVPLDNIHRHFVSFPDQLALIARQLLQEIEEVGLESPTDHVFVDAATRILPQICPLDWIFANGPAFGDSAIVHRELGGGLAVCYVIDDPWSVVFVCRAHLKFWGRKEQDMFHLANQNLRRMSDSDLPLPTSEGGPVKVDQGDGYDAARVLLLDPELAEGLLVAMPERDSLYLGQAVDRQSLTQLMAAADGGEHPVSPDLYRIEGQRLVPVSEPEPDS